MYTNNEIMFPVYVIPQLRESRGAEWQAMIDRLTTLPENHPEVLAFLLFMVRLNGCLECETDSYRAMRGCDVCALQTLRRYKKSDEELLNRYQKALTDIHDYLEKTGATVSYETVFEKF